MSDATEVDLKEFIRDIPDFPKPGILFRDITPLIGSPEALRYATRCLADRYRETRIDRILAVEARGFIFAAPLAMELDVGFAPVRKPGKLPYETISVSYELEYGTDTIEMHIDAVEPGSNVLIVDDLLATGGTVDACCKLVRQAGANVIGCAFVVELAGLGGRARLPEYDLFSLISYD